MEVFVYGTLVDPHHAARVLDDHDFLGGATLVGLHAVEGEYPTLVPGGEVDGRILRTDDVTALDDYEGVDRGLYVRVTVPAVGGDDVQAYVGDPEKLGVDAEWPDGFGEERVQEYVTEHCLVDRQ